MSTFVWAPAGAYPGTGRSLPAVARARQRPRRRVATRRARRRGAWLAACFTRRRLLMAGDVLGVVLWAAMVPGLMWLGVAAGF